MNIRKIGLLFLSIVLISLITACGGNQPAATSAPARPPAVVATSQPAAAPTTMPTVAAPTATAAIKPGFITGTLYLMSPPTPRMAVYAVDAATGAWVLTETNPADDGPADFSLTVPPGSYQVFAFADDANIHAYVGYEKTDGWGLGTVTVAADQTVGGIVVRSPGASECGMTFGVPASPDGRFAAVAGPSADCIARLAAGDTYSPVSLAVCETLQEIATQTVGVSFVLEPNAEFVDYLNSERGHGCTLTATGTGADFSDPITVMTDLVNAFVGWTEQPDYQANGPTGAATGLTRNMGLMLVSAEWTPTPGVQCPSDQPIAACELTPEQKQYTIQIQVAQK
jgi:hypothetical protein